VIWVTLHYKLSWTLCGIQWMLAANVILLAMILGMRLHGPFYLHCGIEESCSPGIMTIVCHRVVHHPSEHGTSSMGKHVLAKAHIAKLNELTRSEVAELTSSTVNQPALAILKRQGSRGITKVCSQRKFKFDNQVDPYWLKWQTKRSELAAKDFETSEFHQDTWNCYLMLEFVSAYIPRKSIPNLNLQRTYEALRSDLVLPSATSLSNICRKDYALTVESNKELLPSRDCSWGT